MQLGLPIGTHTLAATIFRSTFYHKDTGAGKYHFGVLSLGYWAGGLPTHQLMSTSPGRPHAKQLVSQNKSQPTSGLAPASGPCGPHNKLSQDLTSDTNKLTTFTLGKAWQPTGPGAAPHTSIPTIVGHSATERSIHHIERALLEHVALMCPKGVLRLLHKATSPKSGHITHLPNRNT